MAPPCEVVCRMRPILSTAQGVARSLFARFTDLLGRNAYLGKVLLTSTYLQRNPYQDVLIRPCAGSR